MNSAPNGNAESKKESTQNRHLEPDGVKSHSSTLSFKPQQQKRILVIDDNPDILFTLRVGLESDPTMQVYGYDNPVTALVEFTPNFYDLLLVDVNMPLLDGFQLAQNLVPEGSQCQSLLYNCRRNKYGSSKRSASAQEYRLFHQEANYDGTTVKTH